MEQDNGQRRTRRRRRVLGIVAGFGVAVVLLSGCSAAADHVEELQTSGTVSGPVTERSAAATTDPAAERESGSWSYAGADGPPNWVSLPLEDDECAGSQQSPIDLHVLPFFGVEAPEFAYGPVTGRAVDTGTTVRVDVGSGSSMVLGGTTYDLVQFHLHAPSEHTLWGIQHDAELHLGHRAADGSIAVVGVFLDVGAENPELDGYRQAATARGGSSLGSLDPSAFLPSRHVNYQYTGSLTTPPCTEDVHWVVFDQPNEASAAQIAAFSEEFGANNRPVQAVNGREVVGSIG